MCGIAGIIDFEDPSQVLQKLQVLSEDIKKEALINLIYLYLMKTL